MKKKKQKGSALVTGVFYTCYVLMIIAYGAGMLFFYDWMNQKLAHFEASVQPEYRAEEVFQSLFAEPDWEMLYQQAGIEDTKFEGKDAFLAYIASVTGNHTISYEAISEDHQFRILANGLELGTFTLENRAKPNAIIPDWQLGELAFPLSRNQSVTVEVQDGHTVFVNGVALDDTYTQEILSTTAEAYLPPATKGIRRFRQQISGLLVAPQVIIADDQGNIREIHQDETTGIYKEIPQEAEAMPQALHNRAVAAGEAYCHYMVEQSNYRLMKYFVSGTDTYRDITSAQPWPQEAVETTITRKEVSDYIRYTEDLFSARIQMTMVLTFEEEKPSVQRNLDSIFFFQRRKDGWKVISMTNDDITEETRQVRLTFWTETAELSTRFYDSHSTQFYAPLITPPEGKRFLGWGEKKTAEDGSVILELCFVPSETGKITNPQTLVPMTLYPVFEDLPALG